MRWWHRFLYYITHPKRWFASKQGSVWSGVSILVFKVNSAEPPRRIRLNYIMLVLALALLAGLPLVNLGIVAFEKGASFREKRDTRTRLVLAYNMRDNLKVKQYYLKKISKQLVLYKRHSGSGSVLDLQGWFLASTFRDNAVGQDELGQKYYNLDLLTDLHTQARQILKEDAYHSLHFLWHRITLHYLMPQGRPLNGGAGMISSGFGYRDDPTQKSHSREFHRGVDFVDPPGTPLTATAPGYVFRAVRDPGNGYGKHVRLHHGFGYTTLYAHCRELNVEKNEYVMRGRVVGFLGNTGRVTGHHVHYEVQFGNEPSVNPMEYVQLR